MKRSNAWSGLLALLLVTLLPLALVACGNAQEPGGDTASESTTTEGTAPAEGAEGAEEGAAEEAAVAPGGDTIIIGSWQEPRGFLDYANNQAIRVEAQQLYRPPFIFSRDFTFQPNPDLVPGELPSLETGGAELKDVTVLPGEAIFSPTAFKVITNTEEAQVKQLVVTGKIKEGLTWSDGEPLTANDFVFAWKTACAPDSEALDQTYCPFGTHAAAGGLISNYEAIDDTTLQLSYVPGALDPLYFSAVYGPLGGPQPAHLFADVAPADLAADERANGGQTALPLGWGPYVMQEWKKGDEITFAPNPNWGGAPAKTPNIIYKFFSDSVALASAVIAGDIDTSSGTTGVSIDQYPYLESVQKNGDITLGIDKDAASFEMLYMNMNDPKDKTLTTPHPVLSDYAVRKAIAMALDRQNMVDTIFFGQSATVDQPHLPQMASYDPAVGKIEFNKEEAIKLLEDAGWVAGEDGIREKDGVRASFTIITTSGNTLRQKATQIIQSNLADVGVEVNLDYQPSSVVFSPDVLYGRAFDAIEFANVFSSVDPGSWWFGVANCGQIPTPENNLTGSNYAGWCDQEASDAVANAAYLTLDPVARKANWDTALTKYFENGYPVVPLFIRPSVLATIPGLEGPALNPTEYFTWNAANWALSGEPTGDGQ